MEIPKSYNSRCISNGNNKNNKSGVTYPTYTGTYAMKLPVVYTDGGAYDGIETEDMIKVLELKRYDISFYGTYDDLNESLINFDDNFNAMIITYKEDKSINGTYMLLYGDGEPILNAFSYGTWKKYTFGSVLMPSGTAYFRLVLFTDAEFYIDNITLSSTITAEDIPSGTFQGTMSVPAGESFKGKFKSSDDSDGITTTRTILIDASSNADGDIVFSRITQTFKDGLLVGETNPGDLTVTVI
jgi:hypothetical protein